MPAIKKPVALSIAGSDPSGGAGIQADLKTFHQFGVYGEAAITLITVQNTLGVHRIECLAPDLVAGQIRAVIDDIPPAAAKTGALGNRGIIEAVAAIVGGLASPLVVDPVILSKHGVALLADDALDALKSRLLPHAFLLTPNLDEAGLLIGAQVRNIVDMRRAAEQLAALGPRAVLVKGGHLGEGDAIDVLFYQGEFREFTLPRIASRNTHGTGCTLSAAITALLACGDELPEAIEKAKRYVAAAIRSNPGLGGGAGPLDHHALF
jgi:hydroxymethylpyrimidine/phosphomethylpyrimidine kinase